MKKNKNGALEFSFAWIFAIIAGLFIIFLAIYGVTKFIGLENAAGNAESAKDIGVLMNPLESSFEALKRTMMTTPVETRIYTTCSNNSLFGEQTIRTSQKVYNKWSDEGVDVAFQNKYIFSKDPVDGKNFYLFSESFEVPFKVADLIYLTSASDKYCFLNSPNDVEQEIKALKGSIISPNENFFLFTNSVDCPDGSIKVCFKRGVRNCPIEVYTQSNFVVKDGKTMYYQGNALMYAAIFSNKEDYECQLDRLMGRAEELYKIYVEKSKFVFMKTGCDSGMGADLILLSNVMKNFQNSNDLSQIYSMSSDINTQNGNSECRLW